MSECKTCKHANDAKGCASTHAETALKLLADGKVEEAGKPAGTPQRISTFLQSPIFIVFTQKQF
jgi:hypothetical protein